MYEKEMEIRLEVGDNAYEVRFKRMTSWSWQGSCMDYIEDYAKRVEVLFGSRWLELEGQEVNKTTYKAIMDTLDKWLYDHPADWPDGDDGRGDYLYEQAKDA